jgi:hypothetical protein
MPVVQKQRESQPEMRDEQEGKRKDPVQSITPGLRARDTSKPMRELLTGRQECKGYEITLQEYTHKKYTSKVPANKSIAEIQDTLVKHGSTGVLYKYEQGTGRIEALQFLLRIKNQDFASTLA